MLLWDQGAEYWGRLQLHGSGNRRKLPQCSEGTNVGLHFSYSRYSKTKT